MQRKTGLQEHFSCQAQIQAVPCHAMLCRSRIPCRAGHRCKKASMLSAKSPYRPLRVGCTISNSSNLRPAATGISLEFPHALSPNFCIGQISHILALVHSAAPLLSILFLSLLPCFLGLFLQTFRKAVGAWVSFEYGRSRLCYMAHLGHCSVAHLVFGVFEAAAFEEDILCHAHSHVGV